jgi:homoaconitate hydratase
MPQNLVEKIVQSHAIDLPPGHVVRSGDFLTVRPRHVMTHDNTSAVIPKFASIGARRIADPRQPVFILDHDVQNQSEENQGKYKKIEAFAAEHGIAFYPAGRGIGHQVLCEEGFVIPGALVVASDSHANLYGGLAALGTPVVRTDAASLWATGTTWHQVPPVTRVVLEGALRQGVSGKDVIITLCGRFNRDEVLNHALEFTGPGVAGLTVDERLTIANMTTEWGALAGVFPCDGSTLAWLEAALARIKKRGKANGALDAGTLESLRRNPPSADPGAEYFQTIYLDLSAVEPSVSGPDQVKVMTPLSTMQAQRVAIQKAYLLSCVNGRADDFSQAAAVLRGRKVAPGVTLYVAAASSEVEQESRSRGDWGVLEAAGARFLPPGCGACIGLGEGLLEPGEVGISATNRNFKGRMGSRDAKTYLASPAVVAASAAAGYITGPPGQNGGGSGRDPGRIERGRKGAEQPGELAIREGFPERVRGEILFLDADNLNTDGIYGKDVTYKEGLSPAEMGSFAFANYDPQFQKKAREGDVLVSGFNFGTGSSREQAATAIRYRGIQLVVAGSFSETYKRNAFNNGFICIECPELVEELRARFSEREPTRRTGLSLDIDFRRSTARLEGQGAPRSFAIAPMGRAAQDLVLAGGLEALVRAQLQRQASRGA